MAKYYSSVAEYMISPPGGPEIKFRNGQFDTADLGDNETAAIAILDREPKHCVWPEQGGADWAKAIAAEQQKQAAALAEASRQEALKLARETGGPPPVKAPNVVAGGVSTMQRQ